jgi:hypothetical protein
MTRKYTSTAPMTTTTAATMPMMIPIGKAAFSAATFRVAD